MKGQTVNNKDMHPGRRGRPHLTGLSRRGRGRDLGLGQAFGKGFGLGGAAIASVLAISLLATPSDMLAAAGWNAAKSAQAPAQARDDKNAESKGDTKESEVKTDLVELVFKAGNVVKGTLVSETESSITVKINVAGITSQATYQKSEIITIKRNLPDPNAGTPTGDGKGDGKKDEAKKDPGGSKPGADKPASAESDDGKMRIYMVTLRGEFGRDVSSTPMKTIVADIKKHQPDILIMHFDQAFAHWGQESPDFLPTADQYDVLENARTVQTYVTEDINRDPEFKKKPRLVGWVKKALGGAAFLPFICPELYFHSEGRHGGIGYLDNIFEGVGDEVARQKQRSLRLGRAVGLAELGGHEPRIMWAMSWSTYVLSYRLEGGKAVFFEGMPSGPSDFLLTDDGLGLYADSLQDILRYRANDVLTLDAVTAERIGFSKGTADTLDELLLALGVTREYKLIEGDSQKILKEWSMAVGKAEQDVEKLLRQYSEVEVKEPGRYKERTAARGQRKRLLLSIKTILDKYGEAINPRAIRAMPEQLIGQIDLAIYRIEQEQRLDKPD